MACILNFGHDRATKMYFLPHYRFVDIFYQYNVHARSTGMMQRV